MLTDEIRISDRVRHNPEVCGGAACIRNTRHRIAGLVQWRRLKLADLEILRRHPDLTQADLDSAWKYYGENPAEIDRAIREDEDA